MFRSPLVLFALPAGLAAGLLAWFAAGGAGANTKALDAADAEVRRLRSPRAPGWFASQMDVTGLAAAPIFPMTTGPAAIPEPAVRLDGVVRTRRRVGALLTINDGPPEWLSLGESRGGVRLIEVSGGAIKVDTVFGPQTVRLGERVGPTATGIVGASSAMASPVTGAPTSGGPPVGQTIVDQPPPGFRSPPPPASAPGVR